MPNWSTNYLVATGEADALSTYEAWIDAVLFNEDDSLTEGDGIVEVSLAQTVLPVPEEFIAAAKWGDDENEHLKKTPEELDDLKARYGSRNAFDWQCANWGTKWSDTDHQVVANFVTHDISKPRLPHLDLTARPSHTLRYTTPWTIGEGVVAAVSALHPDLDIVGFGLQEEGIRVALSYRAGQKVDEQVEECNSYHLTMVGDTAGTIGQQLQWAVEERITYLDFTRSFHDIATETVADTLAVYLDLGWAPSIHRRQLIGPWSDAHLDALNTDFVTALASEGGPDSASAYEAHVEALLTCILRSENVPLDVLDELHTPTGRFAALVSDGAQPTRQDVTDLIAGRSDWQEAFKAAYDALTADEKFTYDQMRENFEGGPFALLRVVHRLIAAKGPTGARPGTSTEINRS